jgi:hypothetical protein
LPTWRPSHCSCLMIQANGSEHGARPSNPHLPPDEIDWNCSIRTVYINIPYSKNNGERTSRVTDILAIPQLRWRRSVWPTGTKLGPQRQQLWLYSCIFSVKVTLT